MLLGSSNKAAELIELATGPAARLNGPAGLESATVELANPRAALPCQLWKIPTVELLENVFELMNERQRMVGTRRDPYIDGEMPVTVSVNV